jgi:hypothetical protein
MTKAEVLQEIESLAARLRSKEPSDHDLAAVMDQLKQLEQRVENAPDAKKLSILGLKGLGKEVWADVDADEYVNQLRDEWPRR